MVTLVPPDLTDVDALLAFELVNRAFFEANINARSAAYYSVAGVAQAIQSAIDDAAADRGYQFLVKSDAGTILGRINLRDVQRAHFHYAVLGYRIAEHQTGKGYASAAVRALLDIAFGRLGFKRLEAGARASNLGSVRVLLRNGFTQFGHSRRSFELHGVWHDRLLIRCDSRFKTAINY
jgi:ribosomal-protein-alanine N-acetyltransferase